METMHMRGKTDLSVILILQQVSGSKCQVRGINSV